MYIRSCLFPELVWKPTVGSVAAFYELRSPRTFRLDTVCRTFAGKGLGPVFGGDAMQDIDMTSARPACLNQRIYRKTTLSFTYWALPSARGILFTCTIYDGESSCRYALAVCSSHVATAVRQHRENG
ncbi:hypothetical protein HGRIS_007354 [Hohenbuehelia grisea]|uniref:Uncharacterized protein n=1 Tax=Hohenbuehelia grisea TaxID=104357 RepID=A0ABR3J4P3_9AGAR